MPPSGTTRAPIVIGTAASQGRRSAVDDPTLHAMARRPRFDHVHRQVRRLDNASIREPARGCQLGRGAASWVRPWRRGVRRQRRCWHRRINRGRDDLLVATDNQGLSTAVGAGPASSTRSGIDPRYPGGPAPVTAAACREDRYHAGNPAVAAFLARGTRRYVGAVLPAARHHWSP
jgi:hypothetical protein